MSTSWLVTVRLFRVNCLVETECPTLNNVLFFVTPADERLLRHTSMSPPRSPASQLLTNQLTRPPHHHCHCHQSTSTPSTPQQSTMGQHSTTKISDHLWNRIATQCRLRHVELGGMNGVCPSMGIHRAAAHAIEAYIGGTKRLRWITPSTMTTSTRSMKRWHLNL